MFRFQHKDKQQYLNAKYLADVEAAYIIEQADLTAQALITLLQRLDRDKLLNMAVNAKSMSAPLAAKRVADVISEVAR